MPPNSRFKMIKIMSFSKTSKKHLKNQATFSLIFDVSEHPPSSAWAKMSHVAYTPVSFLLVHVACFNWSPETRGIFLLVHVAARNWSPSSTWQIQLSYSYWSTWHKQITAIALKDLRTFLLVLDHLTIRMLICTDHALFTANCVPLPIVWHRSAHFATCTIKWK